MTDKQVRPGQADVLRKGDVSRSLPPDGVVNVLKAPGFTSHDIVARIRRAYNLKKVGHAGTLDPDAAGVLPVFLGNATRLLEYAVEGTKNYRAEACLGVSTDTGDDSGKVLERLPVPEITEEQFLRVLEGFRGEILQVPPMYSALRVNGKKLYEYARAGIEVERQPRKIEVYRLELVDFNPPYFVLDVECSKGTYIRTLLEDIGKALGTVATMTFLLRTRVAGFTMEEASTLEEINADPASCLQPLETAVATLPALRVNPLQAYRITNGVRTTIAGTPDGRYVLREVDFGQETGHRAPEREDAPEGRFLGVVQAEEEKVRAAKIIFHSDYKPEKKPE